jgi:hypothetical protein
MVKITFPKLNLCTTYVSQVGYTVVKWINVLNFKNLAINIAARPSWEPLFLFF